MDKRFVGYLEGEFDDDHTAQRFSSHVDTFPKGVCAEQHRTVGGLESVEQRLPAVIALLENMKAMGLQASDQPLIAGAKHPIRGEEDEGVAVAGLQRLPDALRCRLQKVWMVGGGHVRGDGEQHLLVIFEGGIVDVFSNYFAGDGALYQTQPPPHKVEFHVGGEGGAAEDGGGKLAEQVVDQQLGDIQRCIDQVHIAHRLPFFNLNPADTFGRDGIGEEALQHNAGVEQPFGEGSDFEAQALGDLVELLIFETF